MAKGVGIQDIPLKSDMDDYLGLGTYSKALADFILHCNTPMTIGLQGDWGSGKTSLMQMIKGQLRDEIASGVVFDVDFNTWQFSQFQMHDQLSLVMLSQLVSHVVPKTPDGQSRATKIKRGLWRITKDVLKKHTGADVDKAKAASEMADDVSDVDRSEVLFTLKRDFAELCADQCGKDPLKRLVFFLDDLDRLLPERAVELMEVLKNFMDVEYCVFVLAIDYNVVEKGLQAKFGLSVKQLGGRSFFDKIIQVPFRMPVQKYQVYKYVDNILNDIGFPERAEQDKKDFVDLLGYSIGFNPRSIKRHANALLLLRKVLQNNEETALIADDLNKLKLLFAALCMETAHGELYGYLTGALSPEALFNLSKDNFQKFTDSEDWPFDDENPPASTLEKFCEIFFKLVDKNDDKTIDEKELRDIEEVLGISSITSVGGGNSPLGTQQRANLGWEDFRGLARSNGVLDLYDQAISLLRPFFNGITRSKNNISFVGTMGKSKSRNAILGIWPGESSTEKGLVFSFYADRLSKLFRVPEEEIDLFVQTLNLTSNEPGWNRYYVEKDSLEDLVALIRRKKRPS